ncbi:dUTP diphosphatase [Siminovitchia sp. FSL H7-0308]|uniref:Dimeric dUTPase (All-alpha-NTP-PPase superfamily) n=1 Tax=Siminovitchia thermophila TaxID=1245522 RepID=A0ABS2R5W9_9BACI|nr:dUTP diphosphatase [Siminovitchia thermophila]MBM7714770.1 dimeric dUTPase (all-alpha-NTP-PPase superfamily) [Siminovitchia thermophila]ONK24464.1 dUTPase [Bacillus sp. VT-16-64]
MTFQDWFTMQRELDRYIETNHGLQKEDVTDKKILALLVEIGELANETRCFKFWSKKPAAEREKILEEFVDGIHFILSIGLDLGLEEREFSIISHEGNEDLVRGFLAVFERVNALRQSRSAEDYEQLLRRYFVLGHSLGFSMDEVQEAYKMKNKVNYKRQDEGY